MVLAYADPSAADSYVSRAIELYERKGDSISAARARTLAHVRR